MSTKAWLVFHFIWLYIVIIFRIEIDNNFLLRERERKVFVFVFEGLMSISLLSSYCLLILFCIFHWHMIKKEDALDERERKFNELEICCCWISLSLFFFNNSSNINNNKKCQHGRDEKSGKKSSNANLIFSEPKKTER